MPYEVRRGGGCPDSKPYGVFNAATGDRKGCHETRSQALAQMRLLYSVEKGEPLTETSLTLSVEKADLPARRVFGWASVAVTKDGRQVVDTDEEVIDPPDLEEAAYLHVQAFRAGGVDHDGAPPLASLIESLYVDAEKARAMGVPDGALPQSGWWIGMEFDDSPAGLAAWRSVADGRRAWFSIEGLAQSEEVS